ncbi:PKD domain-containing protein [Pedobacter sandarakinus]|uniref:PKD domain-containing protein n=1 Tax=Pedobacter sandarakinus TaxID=353156 RepID=UPI002245135F|nr:PKD domain-containing protein [Pedobacter sandarakinus]MCX2573838.1 PKD domain-containing protein [Pedobacter sandarakinus]
MFTSFCFGQITIGTVDKGPFAPGSTIAAPFKIANGCTEKGNIFQLYLSDQNGNFGSEKLIGTYTGFYSTYVNGVIPTSGIVPGVGYKLRIKTTSPVSVSTESAAFEIKAASAVEAKLTSNYLNAANTETFGTCISKANNQFFINNESTNSASVTASITNELLGGTTALNFPTPIQSFVADQAHYTILAKAVMPDGTVGTKAYLLINNRTITAFGTSGNNIVCLPVGQLEFNVDFTSVSGIQNNFPGDIYTIVWGDATSTEYTLCDIKNNGGKVGHAYNRSSCGSTSITSAGTIFNAFPVTINVSNTFCGTVGTPVSSSAKVVVKPTNSFAFTSPGCTNTNITFENTSVLGENPDTNTPECSPNIITYNWFIDGVITAVNKPRSFNLVTKFLTHGEHIIRLESTSSGACDADPVEMKICIQDPPKPIFTLPQTTICSGSILKPTDLSIVDNICDAANVYSWSVTPAVAYANGTNAASKSPEFNFATPGVYTITLNITTPSCGSVVSLPQTVIVNSSPTATLSPDLTLCNLATYDFNNTTSSPTKTIISGTAQESSDTYTWVVVPSGPGTYSFASGSNNKSKYPSIKFDSYDTYTVSVTHKNNCGSVTATQKLTFTTAPVVNAGPDQTICFTEAGFNLSGVITGTTSTQTWVGGSGTFTPNRNALNAVYTPTAAEKKLGTVTLRLRATTALAAPCNQIDDDLILTIKPDLGLTSSSSITICSGNSVAYTPASAVSGTVFNWTASGTSNVTGFTSSGTGNINDVLTNTNLAANGTVTYVITPSKDGCTGTPFNLVVTVIPKPNVTASAVKMSICNNSGTFITLTSNAPNINYLYNSSVTGSITGNTDRPVATSSNQIDDILINTSNVSGSVTYTITPVTAGGCVGIPTSITISVMPSATLANAGADERICNATSYTLKGNAAIIGNGKWTIVNAPNPVTFSDDTKSNAIVSGLLPGNTYVLRWTISDGICSSSNDDVQITVNQPSFGGTSGTDLDLCSGINTGIISLTGQVGDIVRWEKSIDNGTTWSTISATTNPLTFNNLIVTTKFRAVVQNGICSEAVSSVTTITINPATVVADAGANQNICSGNGVALSGNNPAPNKGLWTLVSGQNGVSFANPTLFNTGVSGLVSGEVYTFRWTISGFAGCPPTSSETTITYLSPITNTIALSPLPICSGQSVTISGDIPTGGSGAFTYQWQSSTDGTTLIDISAANNKDLTVSNSVSTFYRRLVNSTICTSVSNEVKVIILPPIGNNLVSADQAICLGNPITPLRGTTPTGGTGIYNYQWQLSIDGLNYTDILGAISINYTPPQPTVTQLYRRVVTSGSCGTDTSAAVKIIVNLPAKAAFTVATDQSCAPFVINATNVVATPYPDRNATYTWFANNVQIGTGVDFPGYTIANQNQTVVIKLVVSSSLGCSGDEISHTFSTPQSVTASYTQNTTQGCGPLNVRFTNTSNSLTAATFKWDFGNGTTSNLAQPPAVIYQPDASGKDVTYTITLTAITSCGVTTQTSEVFVKALPVAIFSPDKTAGCSPFTVTFSNTSPGNSGTYTFDFGDGTTITKTDKSSVSHTYTTLVVKDYVVKMVATNECGTNESSYTINASPNNIVAELVVNSNQLKGCAPFKVDFYNNTKGGNNFVYDFGDGSTALTHSAPEVVSHTFLKAGKYKIILYASNGCSNAQTEEEIEVLVQPTVSFTADKISGCDGVEVKFKNSTKDAIAYLWDFGDGTTSTAFEPTHSFKGVGKNFVVSLTAINSFGCSNTVTLPQTIFVVPPPTANFSVTPGNETAIPNYTFGFKDVSIGAATWEWNFGDGAVSTLQNPSHTYANEGTYTVTLKILNKEGCSATTTQSVRIIGVPGNLNVPNSFMPASAKNEIKTFKAKGRGIKEWKMSIFNKWGQLLWETTKLDDGAPLEGWDGTYNGQEQPQGVYYWKIEVKFINGSDWKGMTYDSSAPRKTGVIYLIR